MAHDQDTQAMQPPRPDPALKRLERFVGSWNVTGRTLDCEEDNVSGRFTFEWRLVGSSCSSAPSSTSPGARSKGLEVIGYDPAAGKFLSTVYSSMAGSRSRVSATCRAIR
jgi:hypothetical protein